jgi:hypothetical protein
MVLILSNCSSELKYLNLAYCVINNHVFSSILNKFQYLKYINLSYTKINDDNVKIILEKCRDLETIDLSENNFEGTCFQVNSVSEKLNNFVINNCVIDEVDNLIQFLKQNGKSLHSLHANACSLNSTEMFEEIRPSLKNVNSFSMAFDSLNRSASFHLLENLVELDLSVSITCDEVFAEILNKCLKLTKLNLAHTYLTDLTFTSLPICAPISDLDIFGAEDITSASLERIMFYLASTLEKLDISACASLTGADVLDFLPLVKKITHLNLKLMDVVTNEFIEKLIKIDFPEGILINCYDCDFLDMNKLINGRDEFRRELLDDDYSHKIFYKNIVFIHERETR